MAAAVEQQDGPYGFRQPHEPKFRLDWTLVNEQPIEPPKGEVLFADKTSPVCDRPPAELSEAAAPFCFTRGVCDVSGIKEKLRAGGDEIWSEEYAARHNVPLERPSHDSWGIKKLAFVFCDDFLQRVYRMPLWEDPEWQRLLNPVFATCGIPRERIIRCLFASMPPHTVIPVHHDSGYWVPRTHRLHCAIKTNSKSVVFRVGSSTKKMQRFDFSEGRVVELNNQAKHYVANLWDEYRTHLIFDYVDDVASPCLLPPMLPEKQLQVGETVLQTRRSIDLKSERGTGALAPHFLIIGAQKAGTTSMYEYLSQHPLVIRGRRRESHFLDWRWPKEALDAQSLRRAWHDNFYDVEKHAEHPSLKALDSTPSFLLASHLAIPRLLLMEMAPPLVVMLRDPVERAVSHYSMILDPKATPEQRRSRGSAWVGLSARDVALDELRTLVYAGALVRLNGDGDPTLTERYRLDQPAFLRSLERLPNAHGAHSMLARGLYAAQLEPWLQAFPRENFVFVRCEDMATSEGAAKQVRRVLEHVRLRDHPIENIGQHFNKRKHLDDDDSSFHAELKAFYRPFNQTLHTLLGWDDEEAW